MGFSNVVAGFWSVPWRDLAGQLPPPPRLESKRRFRGLAAKPSPLSAPAQRELRRALTASADSRASCQLSNSHEKAGPFNSQQFATPCSLKIMERPGTQSPPLLKDIGGLLTLGLLQQVPRCQNPFPAIDTSARVLPLPRARRQCPTAGETADVHPIRGPPAITRTSNSFGQRRRLAGLALEHRSVCGRGTPDWTVRVNKPNVRPSFLRRDLHNVGWTTCPNGRGRVVWDAGREELPILELVPCTAMHAVTSGPR